MSEFVSVTSIHPSLVTVKKELAGVAIALRVRYYLSFETDILVVPKLGGKAKWYDDKDVVFAALVI